MISGTETRCECHACIKEFNTTSGSSGILGNLPLSATKMILCPKCGNKRCPRASNHRLECTGSNAPGQPGSVYS